MASLHEQLGVWTVAAQLPSQVLSWCVLYLLLTHLQLTLLVYIKHLLEKLFSGELCLLPKPLPRALLWGLLRCDTVKASSTLQVHLGCLGLDSLGRQWDGGREWEGERVALDRKRNCPASCLQLIVWKRYGIPPVLSHLGHGMAFGSHWTSLTDEPYTYKAFSSSVTFYQPSLSRNCWLESHIAWSCRSPGWVPVPQPTEELSRMFKVK